jgi:hypothetical protein
MRFPRVEVRLTLDQRRNQLLLQANRVLQQRRRLARTLGRVAYLSAS